MRYLATFVKERNLEYNLILVRNDHRYVIQVHRMAEVEDWDDDELQETEIRFHLELS